MNVTYIVISVNIILNLIFAVYVVHIYKL